MAEGFFWKGGGGVNVSCLSLLFSFFNSLCCLVLVLFCMSLSWHVVVAQGSIMYKTL